MLLILVHLSVWSFPPTPSDTLPFADSRLVTPAHGALLNKWANQSADQVWELCYTSFTMDKSSAGEFHNRCDQYSPTYSVAHNSGGKPGTCHGKCDDQDQDYAPCGDATHPVGSDCSSPDRGSCCVLAKFPPACRGLPVHVNTSSHDGV